MENKENEPSSPDEGRARSAKGSAKGRKKKTKTLQEVKQHHRKLRSNKTTGIQFLMEGLSVDDLEKQPKSVGLIYDDRMLKTRCLWDDHFSEGPDRLKEIFHAFQRHSLLERCWQIPAREATVEEILLVHSAEYLERVKSSANMTKDELMRLSETMDAVYFHPATYESSSLAAGSCVELIDLIHRRKVRNGFAVIRPPGHHALKSEGNGFCIFNNASIAARHALENLDINRILIVDWDVHHGQGIQHEFYDDPRVLYFSIHRYEQGRFWPNLRESDFDQIGKGKGFKYNINIPLNQTGSTDADYLAFFQQVLLPVAFEYGPQLVIVSGGFDAAVGDAEGRSFITPAGYAHMLHMLMSLAGGRVALLLEGGYCLRSLAESAALCLRTLLGDPPPMLIDRLKRPLPSTVEIILQVRRILRPFWRCFCFHDDAESPDDLAECFMMEKKSKAVFASEERRPEKFNLFSGNYEISSPEERSAADELITRLVKETKLTTAPNRTCLVYDSRMRQHKSFTTQNHPERPDRITRIHQKHIDCGLAQRCKSLPARAATADEILLCHTAEHLNRVEQYAHTPLEELASQECSLESVYLSQEAYDCACLAAGCTLNVVDEVCCGHSTNGVAIVRPPGHHAELHKAMGFCYFNNAAIAARYAQRKHGVQRVLILDWDVHHGNGTQHIFEEDPTVLYISIHRRDDGWFFPMGDDNDLDKVGQGAGLGFNVNIPWNTGQMGDAEYLAAFHQVIMPIAYEYAPDLVLISAGFDAARGDPLGGCLISPEGYAHMTHLLTALAHGRVIVILEGGYNLNSISESMAACTSILLGDLCPEITLKPVKKNAARTIKSVLEVQKLFWPCLQYCEKLPSRSSTVKWLKSRDTKYKTDIEAEVIEEKKSDEDDTPAYPSSSSSSSTCGAEIVPQQNVDDLVEDLTQHLKETSLTTEEPAKQPTAEDLKVDDAFEELLGACGGSDPSVTDLTLVQPDQMFAVVPLPWCQHLTSVQPLPEKGIEVTDPCEECGHVGENWVCLICYKVLCSRYVKEHMLMHSLESSHCLVLSFADLSVWCYGCDAYVHNEIVLPAKQAAHISKFKEAMPEI